MRQQFVDLMVRMDGQAYEHVREVDPEIMIVGSVRISVFDADF